MAFHFFTASQAFHNQAAQPQRHVSPDHLQAPVLLENPVAADDRDVFHQRRGYKDPVYPVAVVQWHLKQRGLCSHLTGRMLAHSNFKPSGVGLG